MPLSFISFQCKTGPWHFSFVFCLGYLFTCLFVYLLLCLTVCVFACVSMYVYIWVDAQKCHSVHMEVRDQFVGVIYLFQPDELQKLNSGHETLQYELLPSQLSHRDDDIKCDNDQSGILQSDLQFMYLKFFFQIKFFKFFKFFFPKKPHLLSFFAKQYQPETKYS